MHGMAEAEPESTGAVGDSQWTIAKESQSNKNNVKASSSLYTQVKRDYIATKAITIQYDLPMESYRELLSVPTGRVRCDRLPLRLLWNPENCDNVTYLQKDTTSWPAGTYSGRMSHRMLSISTRILAFTLLIECLLPAAHTLL